MKCINCNAKLTNKIRCTKCNTPVRQFEYEDKNKVKDIGMGDEKPSNSPRYSENKARFDLHNYSYKFIITETHNYSSSKVTNMGNWKQYNTKFYGYNIQINTKSLIIYDKKRHTTILPEETEDKIRTRLTVVAIEFAKKNGIIINPKPIPVSKEIKILDCKVNENFRTSNFKSVYPLPSPVEFTNPSRAVKDAVSFVANLGDWIKIQQEQVLINQEFSKNIKLHMETMDNINSSLASIEKIANKQNVDTKFTDKWTKENIELMFNGN